MPLTRGRTHFHLPGMSGPYGASPRSPSMLLLIEVVRDTRSERSVHSVATVRLPAAQHGMVVCPLSEWWTVASITLTVTPRRRGVRSERYIYSPH